MLRSHVSRREYGVFTRRLILPLRRAYDRFMRLRGTPREIAMGFALGLWVGMTPLMGLHILLAVALAALLKFNKIAAAIAVWITNAITAPFIYSLTYLIGTRITGMRGSFEPMNTGGFALVTDLIQRAPELFWNLTVGGFIVSVPLCIVGYHAAFALVEGYRRSFRKKLAEARARRRRRKKEKISSRQEGARTSVEATTAAGPNEKEDD